MPPKPDLQTRVPVTVDLASTLAPLRVGVSDPCWRVEAGGWWWATRTPSGPVTVRIVQGDDEVGIQAWGEGTEWLPAHIPRLIGALDNGTTAASELVAELAGEFPGFRVAGHGRLADAAIEGVCRRGVSSFEAARSWGFMVEHLGDDAPGPGGLRLPPAPRRLASCDPYELHVWGLERGRADEVRRIASHATRLEADLTDGGQRAVEHLSSIAGIGADAVDHARSVALADADAAPVIDAHATAAVMRAVFAEGAPRGADGTVDMADLMAPHQPHRGRLVRLVALAEAARAADDVGLT